MQGQGNSVIVTLTESRDEIASLSECFCSEGFWSNQEAEMTIADTREALYLSTLEIAT